MPKKTISLGLLHNSLGRQLTPNEKSILNNRLNLIGKELKDISNSAYHLLTYHTMVKQSTILPTLPYLISFPLGRMLLLSWHHWWTWSLMMVACGQWVDFSSLCWVWATRLYRVSFCNLWLFTRCSVGSCSKQHAFTPSRCPAPSSLWTLPSGFAKAAQYAASHRAEQI